MFLRLAANAAVGFIFCLSASCGVDSESDQVLAVQGSVDMPEETRPIDDVTESTRRAEDALSRTEICTSASESDMDARIQELQTRLAELLRRYTERHPDVVAATEMLRGLEEQRAERAATELSDCVEQLFR